jgi:hypothetical protein
MSLAPILKFLSSSTVWLGVALEVVRQLLQVFGKVQIPVEATMGITGAYALKQVGSAPKPQ